MTRDDEYGDDLLEDYNLDFENIDEAFELLYELDEQDKRGEYQAVTGRVWENIRESTYVSDQDAYKVTRMLRKGDIEEAEETVEQLLEPEK